MYDDSWYNAFVPNVQLQPEQIRQRRRESHLTQPNDLGPTDPGSVEILAPAGILPSNIHGPPNATVARRAKSYTDFYHVVRAHIKGDTEKHPKHVRRRSRDNLSSEEDCKEWPQDLSHGLVNSSHEKYQLYHDQLLLSGQHLDSLLEDTTSNLELLSSLSASFKAVEVQTSTFQSRCDGLLSEQRHLETLEHKLVENLHYYDYLDRVTRRLNAPGAGNSVRRDDFSEMLSNLDNCLEYMQTHTTHREANTYQSRYRLLMTRALTLIRVHFTNTLREIAVDVSKRIAGRQLNDTTLSALLYAKFRVEGSDLKRLGLEVQRRAIPPPNAEPGAQGEYQSLMNELYQNYSAVRGRLIIPIVRKKMAELAVAPSTAKDLVAFSRSSLSYLRGTCLDEWDLWQEWFDGGTGLYEFLEAICEPLFDYLRPRTIHETKLPKLCEMCSLLQVRYGKARTGSTGMEDQDEDTERHEKNYLDFGALIRPALEDAQTRLVFLALAVLRDDIERYKPKAEDLDYPARNRGVTSSGTKGRSPALSGKKDLNNNPQTPIPTTPMVVEEEGMDLLDLTWRYDTAAAFPHWYPTLRKAMWLLSRIYRLVNSTVFDDLAHQIVHQTTLSLHQAAGRISKIATPADAQLFLLMQLLILKEQIVAFDIEYVSPDVNLDFSSVTNTFWELRERGGLFNPANLMRLVGGGLAPRIVVNMLDAKMELDSRLRTVINEFTNGFATRMTSAVSEGVSSKRGFDSAVGMQNMRKAVEKEVPALRAKLDEYLEDMRTKETLVAAVQDQALQNYEDFFERHTSHARENGSTVSKKGKGRKDDVWDPDTFADWAATVFGVVRIGIDVNHESSGSIRSRSGSM